MLSGVTVSCFLLSYLIVLGMEMSRIFWRVPGRYWIPAGMLMVGLLAHTIFLVNQLSDGAKHNQLLSNWFQWGLLGAWGLALVCLWLTLRNPNGSVGLFLVPTVLGLIGLALIVRDTEPFPPGATATLWRMVHGVSQLVGTMFISLGLAFALMYLVQSYRLKSKQLGRSLVKLPALDFLRSMTRLSLLASAISVSVGLISGILLQLQREGPVAWLSRDNLITFALFLWVWLVGILELASSGSLGGRRSAYLAIANFVFLLFVLLMVLFSSHGQPVRSRALPHGTTVGSWTTSAGASAIPRETHG